MHALEHAVGKLLSLHTRIGPYSSINETARHTDSVAAERGVLATLFAALLAPLRGVLPWLAGREAGWEAGRDAGALSGFTASCAELDGGPSI